MLTISQYVPIMLSIFKDTEPLEQMDSNKEVISRLKFISKINKGEKLNVRYMFVQQDDMATRLSRTFYNKDNRGNTLNFVRNTIDRSFEIIFTYLNSDKVSERAMCHNIIQDLKRSKDGLINLKDTYVMDIKFCCDMDTILEDIDAKIAEMELLETKEEKDE